MHFDAAGKSTDELPFTDLIASAVVIDVTAQAENNRNYYLGEHTCLTLI